MTEDTQTPKAKPKRKPVGRPALKKEDRENPSTRGGKLLKVVYDSQRDLYKIHFTSGGELPRKLKGHFTRHEFANQKIREYLDSRS